MLRAFGSAAMTCNRAAAAVLVFNTTAAADCYRFTKMPQLDEETQLRRQAYPAVRTVSVPSPWIT